MSYVGATVSGARGDPPGGSPTVKHPLRAATFVVVRPAEQPHGSKARKGPSTPCPQLSGVRRPAPVGAPWPGVAATVLAVATLVATLIVLAPPAHALTISEAEAAVGEARRQLTEAHAEVERAQAAITAASADLGDLQADELALTEQLRSKRRQARRLSVAAYMSGGNESSIELLADTSEATDLLWRQTMLAQQSLDTRVVAREFADLRNGTSDEVEQTVDRLDRLDRRLEDAQAEVPHAERALELAEITLIGVRQAEAAARAARDAAAVGGDRWAALRRCESGSNYETNTGNGFYGAYQFDLQTWQSVGGTGLPSDAPPWEQDARAQALYASRGAAPWPICGRYLLDT